MSMQISSQIKELFTHVAPTFDYQTIHLRFLNVFKEVTREQLDIRIAEFLKFMFLRSKYGGGFIPLSGEVDDIWHEFILQTREYELFCLALPGKKFIHHNSQHLSDYTKDKNPREVVTQFLAWIPAYYHHFGEFTKESSEYWMMVNYLQNELKMSLAEINQLGSSNQTAITYLN